MKRLLFAMSLALAIGALTPRPAAAQLPAQPSLRVQLGSVCKAPVCVYRHTCRCDLFDRY